MNDFLDKLCQELERAKADVKNRSRVDFESAYDEGYRDGLEKAHSLWAQCVTHDLVRRRESEQQQC